MTDETKESHSDNIEQMVTFSLGQEEYAINILQVQEINRMTEIIHVPQSEHYVEGIINLRGKVIPIIELRKKFGMPEKKRDNHTRIVVVEISNETVGLVVDSVSEVLRIPIESFEDAPKLLAGAVGNYSNAGANYIKSVVKLKDRLLVYLDLKKIIKAGSIPTQEPVAAE
jgi:purine-binding chemotaxis protein CheW